MISTAYGYSYYVIKMKKKSIVSSKKFVVTYQAYCAFRFWLYRLNVLSSVLCSTLRIVLYNTVLYVAILCI